MKFCSLRPSFGSVLAPSRRRHANFSILGGVFGGKSPKNCRKTHQNRLKMTRKWCFRVLLVFLKLIFESKLEFFEKKKKKKKKKNKKNPCKKKKKKKKKRAKTKKKKARNLEKMRRFWAIFAQFSAFLGAFSQPIYPEIDFTTVPETVSAVSVPLETGLWRFLSSFRPIMGLFIGIIAFLSADIRPFLSFFGGKYREN
jgi:hypothetical protein